MRDPTTEHKPEMRGNLLICISKMSYIEDITLNYMHVIFLSEIPLSFNGIYKVAVAVERLQQLYKCR